MRGASVTRVLGVNELLKGQLNSLMPDSRPCSPNSEQKSPEDMTKTRVCG